ncbi:hypothetical protein HY375_00090 [Candidatus Berkelbacteria bacterium]|nr:hypothetical protein [Candidatus Berkelbacteria bacterium]
MTKPRWSRPLSSQSVRSRQRAYRHPAIYGTTDRLEPRRVRPSWSRAVWWGLGTGLLIALLGYGLFLSPLFAIQTIAIIGEVTPPVQARIEELIGQNLLSYSAGGMAETLRQSQSSIRDLSLSKGLPNTLRVELALRQPVMAWRVGTLIYFLDRDGVAFELFEPGVYLFEHPDLPELTDLRQQPVTPGKQLARREFVAFVTRLASQFPDRFPLELERLEIDESMLELRAITSAGWSVQLDTTRAVEGQLTALQQVFETYHADIRQYVDLRIAGRAYFK